ncbi:uncharacterized protein TNCV_1935071 [Trichonephila clavipes]|nr:uncharacterized protein TNCV_1935071 [Trichonephila clavipes]
MTSQRYVHDILPPLVLPLMQRLPGVIFKQDNGCPHTARVSQDCLRTVTTLPWPCPIPRFVSNRAYMESFGTASWASHEFERTRGKAVDSLVVRASDFRPEGDARCPTEYVLVKSVGPKFLWAEITSAGDWRMFPSPSVPCLNCGGGDRWCRRLSSLREFLRAKSYFHLHGAQG